MNEKLLCVEDVANLLSVRNSTVYEWARTDYIPHIKIGACVRFEKPAVEKWIAARRKEGRKTRLNGP